MIYFFLILKTKLDQNAHQNTPNLPFKKNSRGEGPCPRTHLAKRMASHANFQIRKKNLAPPPPKSWLSS